MPVRRAPRGPAQVGDHAVVAGASAGRRYAWPMPSLRRRLNRPRGRRARRGGARRRRSGSRRSTTRGSWSSTRSTTPRRGACRSRAHRTRHAWSSPATRRTGSSNEWDMGSWVHPPLGKLTIGLGIEMFSMSSFGWRFTSALAGIGVAVVTALMAQLLFGKPVWTFAAGLLIAVDGLNVVHSRAALLDIHLVFWVALGFLLLLCDRRWIDRRTDAALGAATPVAEAGEAEHPLRATTASCLPLPCACRLRSSGRGASQRARRSAPRRPSSGRERWRSRPPSRSATSGRSRGAAAASATAAAAIRRTLGLETLGIVVAFAIVPVVAYAITWIPWFVHFHAGFGDWLQPAPRHDRVPPGPSTPRSSTRRPARSRPTHGYYSEVWTWIPMLRPVSYFVEDLGPDIRQILAIGNPVLFWGTVWTIPYCAWAWWRTRDLDPRRHRRGLRRCCTCRGSSSPGRSSSSTPCRSRRSWRSRLSTRCATWRRRSS